MSFNLIRDAWIPVRRRDGSRSKIAPWQITENQDRNPIISLDAPRPDFNGALIQFLIGLVQTAKPPENDRPWRTFLCHSPDSDELRSAFESVAHAFELFGDGPRFMQDLTLSGGEEKDISGIFIDAPGGNTLKNNADHFIKRGAIERICPCCAATALFTLQTNAPAGGVGHRTSLRGGGPLTTLILGPTLWHTVWLNVLPQHKFLGACGDPYKSASSDVFPWLGKTRTSERAAGRSTTPLDVHPAHMFWAMPRRIRLDCENLATGMCDLCGEASFSLISKYLTKNYGMNYEGAWQHPLTPYTAVRDAPPNPTKGQLSGVCYRHWLGLVQSDPEAGRMPGRVVQEFTEVRQGWSDLHEVLRHNPRLWVFGYAMDNMKALFWCESTMPLMQVDERYRPAFEQNVARLIKTADLMRSNLRRCLKQAIFGSAAAVKGDLSFSEDVYWQSTEPFFYSTLRELQEALKTAGDLILLKIAWHRRLQDTCQDIFRDLSQSNQMEVVDPKRIALAARDLRIFNSTHSPKICETLDLPKPSAGRDNTRRRLQSSSAGSKQ
jgi:CRISPR system Cascade subunit CasA